MVAEIAALTRAARAAPATPEYESSNSLKE
jgi:hypothetical protein